MDFEFLSSNLQIAYPFKNNVTVARYGADTELAPYVASAQVRTVDQRDDSLLLERVYLESSDDFATLDDAYVKVKWQLTSDSVIMNLGAGTCTAVVQAYGNWVVVELYGPEELTGVLTAVIKLVFPVAAIEDTGLTKVIEIAELTDSIAFHESTVKQGPNEVRRVYWKHGDTLELVADRGEELIVRSGFNMSITQAEEANDTFQAEEFTLDAGRPQTQLVVNAVPGAGLGKYLLCPGALNLLTLNGIPPDDNADMKLLPKECYWLERPLDGTPTTADGSYGITKNAKLRPNELQIKNGCSACCSCDDYLATYEHLRAMWERGQTVSNAICSLRDDVSDLISLYNSRTVDAFKLIKMTQISDTKLNVTISWPNITGAEANTDLDMAFALAFSTDDTTIEDGRNVEGTLILSGVTDDVLSIPSDFTIDTPQTTTVTNNVFTMPAATVLGWIGIFEFFGPSFTGFSDFKEITCIVNMSGGGVDPESDSATVVLEGS